MSLTILPECAVTIKYSVNWNLSSLDSLIQIKLPT